jgi:predicted nucleotidyltransferase component of viral defense system
MEQSIAEQKALELGIDRTQVAREYWELILLKGLYESPQGRYLVFKGGTALRLAYGSPRFSEDLDFSLTKDVMKGKFLPLIKKIISPFPELIQTDVEEKYYTYLAEIKVTQNYLPLPFRIKIEISKRGIRNYQWELKLLNSPAAVLQVMAQVATLEQIYQDKLNCLKGRAKPKDLFDLWYLSEKLGIPYVPKEMDFKGRDLVRDLRKYLPKSFWPAIGKLMR